MKRAATTVAAALTLALAGCAGDDHGQTAKTATDPVTPQQAVLKQAINGPVVSGQPPTPLAVKLGGPNLVRPGFGRPPRAGMLFDLDTGEVLWARNPTRVLPMASVTKMMTALIVVERLPEGSKVKVTKEALAYQGSGVGVLPKGKRVGLQAMLYGLLLASGNDTAIALAQRVAGTLPRFVALMNAKAQAMHLSCTRYARPDGIQDAGNHTCAYDLAALARAVLDNPRLARIVRRANVAIPFPIKGGRLYLSNHNPLLRTGYPGTIGIKTGFTTKAGRCLVAAVQRHGRRLGVVLLHSPDILRQSRRLFDVGFRVR